MKTTFIKKTEDEDVKKARVYKAKKSERRDAKKFIQNQLDEDRDIEEAQWAEEIGYCDFQMCYEPNEFEEMDDFEREFFGFEEHAD